MNGIIQRILENKEKELGCCFHNFVIDKFEAKHACKNCGTKQSADFILGYSRGLQHALEHPELAKQYINYLDGRSDQKNIEKFMEENGLGESDMINDITYPHEI